MHCHWLKVKVCQYARCKVKDSADTGDVSVRLGRVGGWRTHIMTNDLV